MDFKIQPLADNLEHVPTLATWHQAQFGYLNPAVTIEQRIERLAASAQREKLPMTVIALSGKRLLGSASLLPKTITHQHLSPWLSSVYVVPEYRNRGIGSELTRYLVQAAADMGLEKIYLFTPKSEALYARLGWEVVEHSEYGGHRIAIMSRSVFHKKQ